MPGLNFSRLTVTLLLAVIIASIGVGILLDIVYQRVVHESSSENSKQISSMVAITKNFANLANNKKDLNEINQLWHDHEFITLDILDLSDVAMPQHLLKQLETGEPLILEDNHTMTIQVFLSNHNTLLSITYLMDKDAPFIRYLFTGIFYALLITLISIWLLPLIKRLESLRLSAKQFGQGDLTSRIAINRYSYISDIENEFNGMAQKIEDLVSDIKLISSAVSHDLRTPLAKIRLGIDVLEEEENKDKQEQYLKRISHHVDDMTIMVETLLGYARLESALIQLEKKPINMKTIINRAIKSHEAEAKPLSVKVKGTPSVIHGDEKYLSMLVNNLIGNAIKFGKTKVDLGLTFEDRKVVLTVADDGPGIDPKVRQDIFKPFVRTHLDKSGYGVGLAIVKRIADWHHAKITIRESTQLHGTEFMVEFDTLLN